MSGVGGAVVAGALAASADGDAEVGAVLRVGAGSAGDGLSGAGESGSEGDLDGGGSGDAELDGAGLAAGSPPLLLLLLFRLLPLLLRAPGGLAAVSGASSRCRWVSACACTTLYA